VCHELTVLNIFFLSFRIFQQVALPLENGVVTEFFTVFKYFLSFRIFEQLALALKTEFALNIFKRLVRLCQSVSPNRCVSQLVLQISSH